MIVLSRNDASPSNYNGLSFYCTPFQPGVTPIQRTDLHRSIVIDFGRLL